MTLKDKVNEIATAINLLKGGGFITDKISDKENYHYLMVRLSNIEKLDLINQDKEINYFLDFIKKKMIDVKRFEDSLPVDN